MKRIVVAGATGYLGRFVVKAFKSKGYFVRVLTRDRSRLYEKGPLNSPSLTDDDFDEVYLGEVSKPETLKGLFEDIDYLFSCVGISRQRDGLTFQDVDYQCNKNMIELAKQSNIKRITYVSMQGAENIKHLEITKAHEQVVNELIKSNIEYRIVRPCGYYSDMGALFDMAKKGRVFLVGKGENKMNPIYGGDLGEACVDISEGEELEVEVGGPEIMTQREAAILAFDVVGKNPKITVISMSLARFLVKVISKLSKQYGDLADFIVTAGEIDGVGPKIGKMTLRSYFEQLKENSKLSI